MLSAIVGQFDLVAISPACLLLCVAQCHWLRNPKFLSSGGLPRATQAFVVAYLLRAAAQQVWELVRLVSPWNEELASKIYQHATQIERLVTRRKVVVGNNGKRWTGIKRLRTQITFCPRPIPRNTRIAGHSSRGGVIIFSDLKRRVAPSNAALFCFVPSSWVANPVANFDQGSGVWPMSTVS
jgi:hypothetical protein